MSGSVKRLVPGLWRWTARHPEWHPGEFGAEVASFAAKAGDDLLLIDPLLPPDPAPVYELIETQPGRRLSILITIPYHARSAQGLRDRYRKNREVEIWGHPAAAKRLRTPTALSAIDTGTELPGGVRAFAIGKPRRQETPLLLPSHRALVFGDAVVETGGRVRVWSDRRVDEGVERFYRERFNPTLKPLLELDFDRVLVTHGDPVMRDGRRALASALRSKPWYNRA
jgi:glyoxylase-like metal-dependent hydrolase (beta-lactamase superfamily II)